MYYSFFVVTQTTALICKNIFFPSLTCFDCDRKTTWVKFYFIVKEKIDIHCYYSIYSFFNYIKFSCSNILFLSQQVAHNCRTSPMSCLFVVFLKAEKRPKTKLQWAISRKCWFHIW